MLFDWNGLLIVSLIWKHDLHIFRFQTQCRDDEFEHEGQVFSLDYRTVSGDVSLPENAFRTQDFLPHGKTLWNLQVIVIIQGMHSEHKIFFFLLVNFLRCLVVVIMKRKSDSNTFWHRLKLNANFCTWFKFIFGISWSLGLV